MAAIEEREHESLYVVSHEPSGRVKVTKVRKDESDKVLVESVHYVDGQICDCKGYSFNGTCKHLKMVDEVVVGHPMSLHDARIEVSRLIQDFKEDFHYVGLPAEAYEKNENGLVTCVTLIFKKAKKASDIFKEGTWEGRLKGCGLKVRMVVE